MYIETIETEVEVEESEEMGSFNHAYVQIRLGILLDRLGKYTPVGELSLDVSSIDLSKFDLRIKEEIKPDLCLYPKRGIIRPSDILRMKEMPLLAIEVLSPRQGIYDIIEKFKVYFALGIPSCWLVEPILSTVTVYSAMDNYHTFSSGEIVDERLGIRLPIQEIFT
jgi:Uma2 family endonuclease